MNWWLQMETRRKRLAGLSRAELARRAGISESTITKALKLGSRPTNPIRRQVELVLTLEEQVQADEGRAA